MSIGLRTRYRLEHASPDMKNYRAPRPPFWLRIVWALELVCAMLLGYSAIVLILSLN